MRNQDDFDEPNAARAFGSIMNALDLRAKFEARKPVYASGIVIALVAVLGSVIWYSYPRETAQREVMNTPIVRADASDYRVAPIEPGGMAVPYRESTVFNTLRSEEGTETAKVENLLPQPERPVSRDELFAGLKVEDAAQAAVPAPGVTEAVATTTATATAVTTETTTETTTAKIEPAVVESTTTAPAVVTEKPAVAEKVETVASVEKKVADTVSKTEPAAGVQKIDDKPAKASAGGFYVQLGSVRARDGASGEWKKLQKSFSALSPLTMRVQEANLGGKGMFYRIQGGPLTEAEAKAICKNVSAQKPGGCLVVRQ